MAVVRPFRAVRPEKHKASLIAALPYDVMNTDEAKEMVKGNPCSFLHIDRAEINFDNEIDPYDKKVYEKAGEKLFSMIEDGLFIQDKKPCFYIYRLTMGKRSQTGVVACTSIDDYIEDVIKKHEHTRTDKELDRINHVNYCDANTGPIFLTYRHKDEIDNIIRNWTAKDKTYSFTADDGISHEAWIVDDVEIIGQLMELFKEVDYLYIADGHHRAASAVKVGLIRRGENPEYNGSKEFNYFLSVIFPDNELSIMDYNRVVQDLNGLSDKEFLDKVSEKFEILKLGDNNPYRPENVHTFGMYLKGQWYKLSSKSDTFDNADPVGRLDVSILQNNLLNPILGITDPRADKRIDFIGGIRGLQELERRVNQGMAVAFSMYPTSIENLMDIADAGKVMPPKSTWFEPKLRSGLFIHLLK